MSNCQFCGSTNTREATTCVSCKRVLLRICDACQSEIAVTAKYCPNCGTLQQVSLQRDKTPRLFEKRLQSMMPRSLVVKVDQALTSMTGERREATVLCWVIDVPKNGSSNLSAEARYLLNDKIMHHLADIVYRYEGTIERYSGDFLVAFFGTPITHENDAERAVRAALDIKRKLQPLIDSTNHEYKTQITTRIGIHTGKVIVSKVKQTSQLNYTAVGNIINHAEILRDAADNNTILCSFDTYQRTHPLIHFDRIPLLTARGPSNFMWAFRPIRAKENPGQVRGLPGNPSPMIGRQDPLNWMQALWLEMVREQQCRVVLVTGEAGVGKTRLVTEFCREVQKTESQVYFGSCMTYARATPLHLIKDLLQSMLFIDDNASDVDQYNQLRNTLDNLNVQQTDILPYLTSLLGLEQNDPETQVRLDNLDNAALQKLTHAAIRQIIEAVAELQPMALIFEDLHWVDSASRSVIDYLLQTLNHTAVLLILISRSSERNTVLQPLIETARKLPQPLLDLRLHPLSPDEITELLAYLIHKTSDAASDLVQKIVARADGNPFFAEEIVRMLVDHGGIHRIRDTWYITSKAEELIQLTPGTLGDLILARFDRLDEQYRNLLYKASVCGLTFPSIILKSLTPTSENQIEPILNVLIQRRFIVPVVTNEGEYYSFRHALIHEVIYNTLLRKDRQKLHSQIAELLENDESLLAKQEREEMLAHHYAASTTPNKALPYLLKAADNASRRCDYETAIRHFQDALKNVSPNSPAYSHSILQAKIGLGRALKFTGENTEASNVLHDALQAALYGSIKVDLLIHMVDGLRELAEIRNIEGASNQAVEYLEAGISAIEDKGKHQYITLWRSLIDRKAWIRYRQGELEQAFELASSATLGLNPEVEDDPMTLASLYNTLGGVLWEQGNLSEAVNYVQLASDLYSEQRYIWGMANTDVNLGVLFYGQGEWQNAAKHFTRAEKYWLQMGDLQHRAVTLNNLGTLRQAMGQFDQAANYFSKSLELFQRLGDVWGSARVHISLARFHLEQSDMKLADEHATYAGQLLQSVDVEDIELLWVRALLHADQDINASFDAVNKALALARESNFVDQEAECLLALGQLRVKSGDYQQAESMFRESVDLNIQAHSPYGLGLAMFDLGRLNLLLSEKYPENEEEWLNRALDKLKQAAQQFSKLGATRQLARTQRMISNLHSTSRSHREDYPAQTSTTQTRLLPEGEQKRASIVYVAFSSPLGEDDEDVFEAMTKVSSIISAIAQQYQGQLIRLPDGILLAFGAPQAFEDDPERAVLAAWEILEQLQQTTRIIHQILKHGIAITHGEIIAGRIGPQFHTEYMVEGKPIDDVKLMIDKIPSSEVWVDEEAKKASERIAIYQPVTDYEHLWRLDGFYEQPRQMRGIPGLRARLIGRDSALNDMVNLTKHLSQGLGGLIWIEGEPGIGKSRLIDEFVTVMSTQGIDVWQGCCSPQNTEVAFSLFTDLLAQRFNLRPRDPAHIIQQSVSTLFSLWPRSLQITQPYLEVLLGVWPTGLPGERLAKLEPEQLRQQIFVSLRRFFKVLSRQNPLVVILDDIHWSDTISAELLQFLLSLIATSPIMFVCAQRRQGSDAPNDRLASIRSLIPSQTRYLQLQRLTQPEREALLCELLPRNHIPEDIRNSILSQSDGNPYFIEEFVRMLVEQSYFIQQQDEWIVNRTLNAEEMPLPTSLEILIRARIDALEPDLKQVIQAAAVLGAPFNGDILQVVCDSIEVRASLDRLASRLLVRLENDHKHWTFHHPLIEGVAYKSILNVRLQAYHQNIAEILEKSWEGVESEHAEVLAYHLTRANQGARALNYLITAGERAAVKFANEQAVGFLEQAAQILNTLPGVSDIIRWRLAASLGDVYRAMGQHDNSIAALQTGLVLMETGRLDPIRRAGLYRRMGDTMRKQGDYDTAMTYFNAAILLLDKPNTEEMQRELARIFCGLAWAQFHQGLFEIAKESAEQGLIYANSASSVVDLAALENLLGGFYYSQSEWGSASHHTRKAMVLREQMGYTWGVASTLGNLGVLAVLEGDWHKAHSFFERSLGLREEMDDVEGLALVHNNLGMLFRDQGHLDRAERHFRDSLEASKPFAHSYHTANATLGLAYVLFLKGDPIKSQQLLSKALSLAEEIGASDVITEAHRVQVELHIAEGNLMTAQDTAYAALERARESGNKEHQASLWRLISSVELVQGNIEEAEQALEKAKEILKSITNMLESGRVHAQAACIALAIEDQETADFHLKNAQVIFRKLGADFDITRIHQLAFYRDTA